MLFETLFAKKDEIAYAIGSEKCRKSTLLQTFLNRKAVNVAGFKMLANMMKRIVYGKTVVVYLLFLFFVGNIRYVIRRCVLF